MNKAPENLIETLKESLRRTRIAESDRKARLEDIKLQSGDFSEDAERIEQEISVLQMSARQTEAAIESLSKGLPGGIDIREQ